MKLKYPIIIFVVHLTSCITTLTGEKKVHLKNEAYIKSLIGQMTASDSIMVRGVKIKIDDQVVNELGVTIINSHNVPNDKSIIDSIHKSIAELVMRNLKDPNEFDTYNIGYYIETKKGIVTTKKRVSTKFRLNELN